MHGFVEVRKIQYSFTETISEAKAQMKIQLGTPESTNVQQASSIQPPAPRKRPLHAQQRVRISSSESDVGCLEISEDEESKFVDQS